MALIVNQQEKNEKDQQAQPEGTLNVSGAPVAAIGAGGVAPAGPSKGSGRFVNLQRYLGASQGAGQDIASRMGQTVGRQGEQLDKDVNAAKGVQSQIDAERQRIAQAGGFAQQIANDPRAIAQNQAQLQQFQQLRTGQTGLQGIQQAAEQGFSKAQTQLGQFQQAADLTGSEAGRFELLGQTLGRPTYSRGQRRLDQLLVQAGGGDVLGQLQRDMAGRIKGGTQALGQAREQIGAGIAETGTQAQQAQQALLGAIGRIDDPNTPENEAAGAFGGIDTQIGQAYQTAQQQEAARKASYDRVMASLQDGGGDVSTGANRASNALNKMHSEGIINQQQFDELSELINKGKLDVKRQLNIEKILIPKLAANSTQPLLYDETSGEMVPNPNYNSEMASLIEQGASFEGIHEDGEGGSPAYYNLVGRYFGNVEDFLNQQDKYGYMNEAENIKETSRKKLSDLGYNDPLKFLKDYVKFADPTQLQRQAFMSQDQSERLKALHTLAGTTPGQSLEMKDQPIYKQGSFGYDVGKAQADIQRNYDYLYSPVAQQQQMEQAGIIPRTLQDIVTLGPSRRTFSAIGDFFSRWSDKNLKTNVQDGGKEVGQFLDSIKAHKYDYKNPAHGKGKQLSVMAQDLEKTDTGKSAVEDTPEGKIVHYGQLQAMMLAAQADLHKRLKKLENN